MFVYIIFLPGLNVQLNLNNEIKVFNLMCREVKDSHTGINIKNWLKSGQELFNIEDHQILGISIDSASNMTLGASLFIDQLENYKEKEDNVDVMQPFDFHNIENQNDCDEMIEVEEDVELIDNAIRIHCVVHRLQLGVNDFLLKNKTYSHLLSAARKISAKLRNPLVRIQLEQENLNMATIDQVTRWSSSFKMVERLLTLKDFCILKEPIVPGLHLSLDKWEKMTQLHNALKPVAVLTSQLQDEKLDVSQFLFYWKTAMHKLEKVDNSASKSLRNQILLRENLIFSNIVIITATFLDKRFYFLLSDEQKKNARSLIRLVSSKQKSLSGIADVESVDEITQDTVENDSFEKKMEDLAGCSFQSNSSLKDVLHQELVEYEKIERLKSNQIKSWISGQSNELSNLSSAEQRSI